MRHDTITEFIQKNLFETKMNAGGLDGWSNYSGFDWSSWLCGLGMNRDSDILDVSNFETALEMLGGEVEGQVEVRQVGHWACGWFKQIMIHSSATDKVQILKDIHDALEQYPVLDDSDYSEREHESYSEYAEQVQEDLAEVLSEVFKIKNTKKLISIAFDLNMEAQYRNGADSCINIYSNRTPSVRDLQELKACLESIQYNYKNSRVFNQLLKAVNNYQIKESN